MSSLVNTETGEILDVEAAEMRASFICTDLDFTATSFETAMGRMREAIEKRDDIALGYRSPGDYLSDRFGGRLARLGVDLRREVVRELTAAGLSKRAIAPVVGVSHVMVGKDRAALEGGNRVTTSQTPAPESLGEDGDGAGQAPEGEKSAATEDGPSVVRAVQSAEECGALSPSRPPVTGIDGKVYSLPMPRPALRPAPDVFTDQDWAEDLARTLSRNLSLLYALTNPERRADYIATWAVGVSDIKPLGWNFITPTHMRALADALNDFATEWENAHA